jgi:ABC transporter substrate binding protein
VLTAQSRETSTASWESFRQGLRDLGWEEGRNLVTEARFADGIVMVEVGDPVATGFVTNLARPGGNVTGVSLMLLDLTQKRLALLREAVPRATRIAVIMNPDDPIIPMQCRAAEVAAGRLGVRLQRLDIRNADDLRRGVRGSSEGQGRSATSRAARRAWRQ